MTKKQSISIRALHRHNSDSLSVQEYEVAIRIKKMYNLSDLEKELGRPIDNERDLLTAVFSTLINSVLAGREPAPIPYPPGKVWDGKKWIPET